MHVCVWVMCVFVCVLCREGAYAPYVRVCTCAYMYACVLYVFVCLFFVGRGRVYSISGYVRVHAHACSVLVRMKSREGDYAAVFMCVCMYVRVVCMS